MLDALVCYVTTVCKVDMEATNIFYSYPQQNSQHYVCNLLLQTIYGLGNLQHFLLKLMIFFFTANYHHNHPFDSGGFCGSAALLSFGFFGFVNSPVLLSSEIDGFRTSPA